MRMRKADKPSALASPQFLEGAPRPRKYREVGFDLETTGLEADFHHLLCAVFKPVREEPVIFRLDDYPDREPWDDAPLVADIRAFMADCSKLFGWYSRRFDLKFIRTRAFLNAQHHPPVDIRHADLWEVWRREFNTHNNRLGTAVDLLSAGQKPYPRPEQWRRARYGDRAAMDIVVARCLADVVEMEPVFLDLDERIQTWSRVQI